ncbi:MAG: hypothetical protein R3E94_14375 [Burkholderiaceae bacterium]
MAELTADPDAQPVRHWPTLNIQRLFGAAMFLKVVLAGLGYAFDSPLWLGFVAPLVVMVAYMIVGYRTRGSDVAEDKFADSCYYLGFIFTIASIVVCLLDVPKMSIGSGLQDIALRFGAAMVSTVLGMAVRVYLVSFRKDSSDALQDVEQALLDTTRMFTVQLQENLKTLQSFEQQVISAGKSSVASVQVQVEALSRNFSETLSQFYAQLNEENRAAFREMAEEGRAASSRLSAAVDGYSQGMQSHLSNIESKVTQFADAVKARLVTTEFPDDYFAKRLKAPMDALAVETQNVGDAARAVNDEVKGAAVALRSTIGSLNAKLKSSIQVMDGVVHMADRHDALLVASEKQALTYSGFLDRLADIKRALDGVVAAADATNMASGEVLTRLAGLTADSTALREAIRTALAEVAVQNAAVSEAIRTSVLEVAAKFERQTAYSTEVLAKVDEHDRRTAEVSAGLVQALRTHGDQVDASSGRFEAVVSANEGLRQQLEAVVASNGQLLEGASKHLEHIGRVAAQSEQIAVSLSELCPLLDRHVDALQASAELPLSRLVARDEPAAFAAPPSGLPTLAAQGLPLITPGPAAPISTQPPPHAAAGD